MCVDPECDSVGNRPPPEGAPEGAAPSWDGPLFVVGMPRSGTKLLRDLLRQHPAIRIPVYETDFIPLMAHWVRDQGEPNTPERFHALFERVRIARYFIFRESARGPMQWRDWFDACAGRYDAAGLFEGFIRCETGARRGDGIIWGDKSPQYIEHLPLLVDLFPNARIVHLVRDVRDYCLSVRKAWKKDLRRAAVRWNEGVMSAHEQSRRAPGRFCQVHYEQLLLAPERELRRLSQFIGVEFTTSMLRMSRPTEKVGDARGHSEIKTDNAGKFESELTAREVTAIEALAWDGMHAMGYVPQRATAPRRLSGAALGAIRVKDGLAVVWNGVQERGPLRAWRLLMGQQRIARS